ncbi:MAG: thioredoxin family protein [Alphaproteobacteria bacterium]|nr:thioredoxin family protein [Alphaproteobacteria bacterium]
MKIPFFKLLRGLFCLLLLTSFVNATDKAPVELNLVSGGLKGQKVLAGLEMKILPEWHVYGPTPQGEDVAGFEPTITWDESSNLKNLTILWPPSLKTEIQEQLSYVYEGNILIPFELTPEKIGEPVTLNLKISLLACASMCVPIDTTLSLILSPADKEDDVFKAVKKWEKSYEGLSLFSLILIALLGGFILNFMPCVLPVLSLKVISLVKQSKKATVNHAKQSFVITGIGILSSFLILALITVLLKASGSAFGWGIHFQNPHFLLFVFLVLVAFSASLLGIFEIDLPSGFGTWLITHEGKGRVKDFLSGVFATLLATPCSAPFVGTALSFALARQTGEIFLVFFFLGLGFAFPYFLLASLPQRFIVLPKPGMWMLWVQRALGGILVLTALWIGWILSFHLSLLTLLLSTLLAVLAISLFWIKHHSKPTLNAWLYATPLFLIAWSFSWILQTPEKVPTDKYAHSSPSLDIWQPFQPEAIPTLVSRGKIVFVDATAEWCVTCAVNKSLVLNNPKITNLLSHPGVIAMRADWTKQDPKITEFLQKFDRYGIPFNIVFGPNNPEGIPLPEVLSVSGVEEVFQKAGLKP